MTNPPLAGDKRAMWIAALVAALLYPIIGIAFAAPLAPTSSLAAVRIWRLAAWGASAAVFAGHLTFEFSRVRRSPLHAALHSSGSVALGAFLLAVWINLRLLWIPSAHQSALAPLALVIFPLVTGVPAFFVGWISLSVANRLFRHANR